MPAPYSADLRDRLLTWYAAGLGTVEQAAQHFMVGPATASRWVARFRKSGERGPRSMGGVRMAPLLGPTELETVRRMVEEVPSLTVDEIIDRLADAGGPRVSPTTMKRALKKLGLTRKKNAPRIEAVNTPRVQELRREFLSAIPLLRRKRLVFLDEFGANIGMVPTHGRAPRGQRVHIDKPSYRSPNVTFAGAMTLDAVLTVDPLPGNANIANFVGWVTQYLVPHLDADDVVVMDNLRAHRNEEAVAAITASGAGVLFLPPYSPDLNPIEACWSKIKSFVRKAGARTHEALVLAVDIAVDLVTATDARGWFSHAGYQHA